jgi:hypothetical protein
MFLVACAAIIVGACSSAAPAAPALTDPKEILTKSILSLKDVKSVHFKAEASGQVKIDLTGQGGAGAVDLKGTTAEGDLDIGNKKLKLGFAAPGLFGVTGEVIQIVNDSYLKVNLLGEKYQKSTSTPDASGEVASDPLKVIQEVNDFLNKPGVAPTKLADERCGDKDCYHVAVNITSDQLGDSLGGLVPSGAPGGTGVLDLWVQKDSLRPAKLGVKVTAGDMGTVDVLVTFSNYDAAVTIEPPPADQVQA